MDATAARECVTPVLVGAVLVPVPEPAPAGRLVHPLRVKYFLNPLISVLTLSEHNIPCTEEVATCKDTCGKVCAIYHINDQFTLFPPRISCAANTSV